MTYSQTSSTSNRRFSRQICILIAVWCVLIIASITAAASPRPVDIFPAATDSVLQGEWSSSNAVRASRARGNEMFWTSSFVPETASPEQTGTMRICVDAADIDVTGIFSFTVEGVPGSVINVPAGFCSDPITVITSKPRTEPFTVKVTELAAPFYRLINVTTEPAFALVGPFTRDAGFDANGQPLSSNTNGGYAVVDMTAGGADTSKIVRFTNQSLPGRIKVCKITADEANIPVGTLFTFTVSGLHPTSATQTLPGVQTTETMQVVAGPVLQNGFCAFAPGTWIVGTPVTVTETGSGPLANGMTFADVRVSRITALPGLTTSNLAGKTATLNARNTLAEIDMTNFVFRPAVLKICKSGTQFVTGSFSFTMSLPDPLTSYPVSTTPITVPVGSCTFAQGPFPPIASFPGIGTFNRGTQLKLKEAPAAPTYLASVSSPTGGAVTFSRSDRTGTITLDQNASSGLLDEINFLNSMIVEPPGTSRFDFDGDGKADIVVYRGGTWWYAASGSGMTATPIQFGLPSDKPVPADYDGDGKTDPAVYRDGTWYVYGTTAGFMSKQFGLATDIPQTGDFDGDGRADFAVFRPSDGTWYVQDTTAGFSAVKFGLPTDKPVAADYDGDGKVDPAVYRDGMWYILGSTAGFSAVDFGKADDIPLPADYDGDHKADLGVFRQGTWHLLCSNAGLKSVNFGTGFDVPVSVDYDGDGKTDLAVYRPENHFWFIMLSSSGAVQYYQFGTDGDVLMNY